MCSEFSTNWTDDPVGEFFQTFRGRLSDSDQASILCETAASLYRLDLDRLTPVAAEASWPSITPAI